MKTWFLLIILCLPTVALAQESAPLSVDELREVLGRLQELKIVKQQLAMQTAAIERDRQQDIREAQLNAQAIELAKGAKAVVEKDRDQWKERAERFQSEYEILAKKRGGAGCFFQHLFTLWLKSCGG